MKLYKEFERRAFEIPPDLPRGSEKTIATEKKYRRKGVRQGSGGNTRLIVDFLQDKREDRRNIARGLIIWREAYKSFFGLTKIKIDSIDIRLLKKLLEQYDIDEFSRKVLVFFYEYRFERWYRERQLVPKIPGLLKNWNRIAVLERKFLPQINQYFKYQSFYDFLGLQPLVEIKNKIPFGLDLPDDIKKEGFQLRDIILIDDRRLIIVDQNGIKRECYAYCHFGYQYDVITNSIKVANKNILWLKMDEINDFYLNQWRTKDLQMEDKRVEFDYNMLKNKDKL